MTISSITHPIDQMSAAPSRPLRSLRMISGAMYIGVPAREFMTAGPSGVGPLRAFAALVRAIVLLPFAMTLAAPKSTSLRHEAASKISIPVSLVTLPRVCWLTVWLDITMFNRFGMQVIEARQDLCRVDLNDFLILNTPVLEEVRKTAALAVLFEDIHSIPMHLSSQLEHAVAMTHLDTNVFDNVGVRQHAHHVGLVLDLLVEGR